MLLIQRIYPMLSYLILALWVVWGGLFAHNLGIYNITSQIPESLARGYSFVFDKHLFATALSFSTGMLMAFLLYLTYESTLNVRERKFKLHTYSLIPLILFSCGLVIKLRHDLEHIDWMLFFSLNLFQIIGLLLAYPRANIYIKFLIIFLFCIDFLLGHRLTFLVVMISVVCFHIRNTSFACGVILILGFTGLGLIILEVYEALLGGRDFQIEDFLFSRLSLSHVSIIIYELMSTYPSGAFSITSEIFEDSAFFILDSGLLNNYIDWMPRGTGVTILAQMALSENLFISFSSGFFVFFSLWILKFIIGCHWFWLWPLNFLLVERLGDSLLGFLILFLKIIIPFVLANTINWYRNFMIAKMNEN